MIIDCHGHYTTAPSGIHVYRAFQIAFMNKPNRTKVSISDDEIRESLENGQLKLQVERGTDLMLFSPRASHMGHHFGGEVISREWTQVNNDLIRRVCDIFPDRFIGVCSLPQSPGVAPRNCVEELERCINELGFVGCNLNPDPSGGWWTDPPLGDEWWYPLYEKMVELDVPAMIHGSSTCNPAFHTTGSHYMNVDNTGIMQLLESRVFEDFPTLRIIMPHGGGVIPYQLARYRALSIMNKWEPFEEFMRRFYFDTAVYSPEAMELLIKIVGVDRLVFASEMLGGVPTIDPNTGRWFDDNKPLLDEIAWLSADDRQKIFEDNVKAAYPRLRAVMDRQMTQAGG